MATRSKRNKEKEKLDKEKKYREFKKKVRNITIYLLENLFNTMEDLGRAAIDRKEVYRVFYQDREFEWRDSMIGRWLQNLKQRDLINFEYINGVESIVFTNKAKMKIVDKIALQKNPDNIYRFISFDIPEKMRKQRNQFRTIIKKIGFVRVQKSLWATDCDVTDLVEMASYEYGIEKYVAYIVSSKSDIDGIIYKLLRRQSHTKEKK